MTECVECPLYGYSHSFIQQQLQNFELGKLGYEYIQNINMVLCTRNGMREKLTK